MIVVICAVNKQGVLGNIAVDAGAVCPRIIVSIDVIPNVVERHLSNSIRGVHVDAAAKWGITNNIIRYEALTACIRNGVNISSTGWRGVSRERVVEEPAAADE